MRKAVLDTSVLLGWWNDCRSRARGILDVSLVQKWAQQLIKMHDANAVVTPVRIEVIGGVTKQQDYPLTLAYLEMFRCIDNQRILSEDWEEALRLARRIPRSARPRDLGDCLIRAIATRLKHEVDTRDRGFPPR